MIRYKQIYDKEWVTTTKKHFENDINEMMFDLTKDMDFGSINSLFFDKCHLEYLDTSNIIAKHIIFCSKNFLKEIILNKNVDGISCFDNLLKRLNVYNNVSKLVSDNLQLEGISKNSLIEIKFKC